MDNTSGKNRCGTTHFDDGQELTPLECSMMNIIKVFHSYAGERCKLTKKDLKKMINTQMSTFVKSIQDPKTLDRIFTDLDTNNDQEIDFSEYAALVAMVTSACHTSIHEEK
ncbi:protein S100-A1-like [Bombina bombina]|uniref:protein S100-A1-like n=1 Tax=Bombina bombina TaxID=8345 RepID=UPI00235ADA77|nr:protein S100-A1-like [Bombina bombina]